MGLATRSDLAQQGRTGTHRAGARGRGPPASGTAGTGGEVRRTPRTCPRAAALLPTHSPPSPPCSGPWEPNPDGHPWVLMLRGSQLGSASGALATDQGGRGEARSSFPWLPPCRGSPQGGWVLTPKAVAPLTDSCIGFRPGSGLAPPPGISALGANSPIAFHLESLAPTLPSPWKIVPLKGSCSLR